ncbi:MAG TPA: DUF6599 family protein, partial [Candidatus Deferrimicrobiaceae bacterium]|nr:DUF6599 family protein [Candidatus Deferrimicrobiaceae bacterium]
ANIARGPALAGLVLLLLLAGPRCAGLPARSGKDASLLSRLAERSWAVAEPARTFGPGNLYEEIDGEAELFLPFGFRELTVGIVTPPGNDKAEVRLELFRHATSRDAFGIYSQHRFPGQEVATVGTSEAIVSDTSLDFFQGTHFARVRAASRTAARSDLEKLGRDLSDLLPGTGDPPPETQALRIPGLVDGSIVFHKRALLGYEALAPGYEAKYESGGITATLILIRPEDSGPASQFRGKLSRFLPGFADVETDLFRADLPSGTLWLMSRYGYRFGVAGKVTRAQAEEVLAQVGKRLPPI